MCLFPQTWQLTSISCFQIHFQSSLLNLHWWVGYETTLWMFTCPCLVTIKTLTLIAQVLKEYSTLTFLPSSFPIPSFTYFQWTPRKFSSPHWDLSNSSLITTFGVTMFFYDLVLRHRWLVQHSTLSTMGNLSHSPTFLSSDVNEEKQSHSRGKEPYCLLLSRWKRRQLTGRKKWREMARAYPDNAKLSSLY